MATPNKLIEGSAAEEATETPTFEKKEDAKSKGKAKKGKRVSARGAKLMANLMKAKNAKNKVVAPAVDAEDKLDKGIDEGDE